MKFPVKLRSVLLASDTESSRYALGGVFVERDGKADVPRLSATCTDGRRLTTVSWEDGDDRFVGQDTATLVPKKAVEQAAKNLGKRETQEITIDELPTGHVHPEGGSTIKLATKDSTIESKTVDGRFPKWKSVVPSVTVAKPAKDVNDLYALVTIDARFLKDIAETVIKMGDDQHRGLELLVPLSGEQAVVVKFKNDEGMELTSVIMPLSKEGPANKFAQGYTVQEVGSVVETTTAPETVEV